MKNFANLFKRKFFIVINGFKVYQCEYFLQIISIFSSRPFFHYSHVHLFQGNNLHLNYIPNDDFSIRFADLNYIDQLAHLKLDIGKTRERLLRGDKCLVTVRKSDDRVVSYLWSTTGNLYSDYTINFFNTGEDGFYIYSGYTLEEEQSKGLYSNMLSYLICEYQMNGRPFVYGIVDHFNSLSLRLKMKYGFVQVGECFSFIVLGLHICYYKFWLYYIKKLIIFTKKSTKSYKII